MTGILFHRLFGEGVGRVANVNTSLTFSFLPLITRPTVTIQSSLFTAHECTFGSKMLPVSCCSFSSWSLVWKSQAWKLRSWKLRTHCTKLCKPSNVSGFVNDFADKNLHIFSRSFFETFITVLNEDCVYSLVPTSIHPEV